MIGKIVAGLLLVLLAGYGLFEARPLLLGPSLAITSPKDGETVAGGLVHLVGHVERTTALTLNGAALLGDDKGDFSSTLTYPSGTTILTFTARDRFGRIVTLTRTIYVPTYTATTTNS